MNVKKITEIRIPPSRAPWSPGLCGKDQILVLDDGEQFPMSDRHLAGVVPIVGDWLVTSDKGREIFQQYKILRTEMRATTGEIVLLCDGLRVAPAELNPSGPVPQVGDYLIRKTDGYHVLTQRAFEDSHALVLGALKSAREVFARKCARDAFARSTKNKRRKSNRRRAARAK